MQLFPYRLLCPRWLLVSMRTKLGLTITTAAHELDQWPSKISLLERGLLRNDALATNYRKWLSVYHND